ncbi:hypothetical protein, partial [Thermococcus sp.]
MRVFLRDYLLPWLLAIGFWLALWLLIPTMREHLNAVNLLVAFILLFPFLLVAFHFAGKTLERYGYSWEGIKRLPEIIEKTHGRLYLAREVFDIITGALMFWGFVASAVLMSKDPLTGILNGVAMFADVFAFFVLLLSMVIWVLGLPSALHRLLAGGELNGDFLIELMRENLVFTAIL